jgi:hypothetical protein
MPPVPRSNLPVAMAAVSLGLVMASVPLFMRLNQTTRLIDKEGSLTGSQIQRGVFMNSGTQDAGE